VDTSSCRVLLRRWSKLCSMALYDSRWPPVHQQKPPSCKPTACVVALELLLSSVKLDHPVCGTGPSDFPACSAFGRHLHNSHLLRGSLRGQNIQLVLAISGEGGSVAESTDRTTRPRWTSQIHHWQRLPRPKHWWLDREVRCQMMLLLMMLLIF
jgi:hypothetical protein